MSGNLIRETPIDVPLSRQPRYGRRPMTAYRLEGWVLVCPCGVGEIVPGDDPPELYTCTACNRQRRVQRNKANFS